MRYDENSWNSDGLVLRLALWGLLLGSCIVGTSRADDVDSKRAGYAKVIDSLASQNPEPKLVRTERGRRPIFAKDFNWEDQSRVRKALARLCSDGSEDLWDELAKHTDDKRYSITMTEQESIPTNYSVEALCSLLLEYRITAPYEQYRVPVTDEKLVYLHVPIDCDKWREQGMSIREMQVKACELAVKAVPAAEGISDEARRKMAKNIDAEREKLKNSRTAAFDRLSLEGYAFYNSYDAEQFREEALKEPGQRKETTVQKH